MVDFAISHPFFFNKPLQIHPTSKPTMESTQNNSKVGLAPIKAIFVFLTLGLFPKIKITKDEVSVLFSYLSLFKISLLSCLITKEQENWKKLNKKLDLLQALALLPFSPFFVSQKRDCLRMSSLIPLLVFKPHLSVGPCLALHKNSISHFSPFWSSFHFHLSFNSL